MPRKKVSDVADRDELLRILTDSAREGSVTAAKTLLEELRRDADDGDEQETGFDALDNVTPIRKAS